VRAARRTGAEAVSCALLALDEDATGELAAPSDGTVWVSVGGDPAIGTVYNTFSGAGLLVRREVALDDGGFHSTAGAGREDWALLARMTLRKRALLTVPLPLYHHRLRPDSLIRTTSQYRNATAVFDEYGPFLPEELRGWPALVRGQAELIGQLNQWLGQARVDIDWLQDELAKRNRYLDFLLRENGG
jgi:hypothetical protein